jgi:hypothetical protein
MSSIDLPQLAAQLESGGFVGLEPAIRTMVQAARAQGVSPVLVGILADVDQPDVARLRAFGRVAAALARPPAAAPIPVTRTAA